MIDAGGGRGERGHGGRNKVVNIKHSDGEPERDNSRPPICMTEIVFPATLLHIYERHREALGGDPEQMPRHPRWALQGRCKWLQLDILIGLTLRRSPHNHIAYSAYLV